MPGNFPEGVVREGPTEVTFRVGDYSGRQWGKQSRKGEEPGKSPGGKIWKGESVSLPC